VLGAVLIWLVWARGALPAPGLVGGVFLPATGWRAFAWNSSASPMRSSSRPATRWALAWHVGGYGLTMGQILSLPMILLGLWLLSLSRRRRRPA
jgi:phosphatidylglycerol---prolipoprotein diacylglyceryl transferase